MFSKTKRIREEGIMTSWGPHFLSFFFMPKTILLQHISFILLENVHNKTHELITSNYQPEASSHSCAITTVSHSWETRSIQQTLCLSPRPWLPLSCLPSPHEWMPRIPRVHGIIGKRAVYFIEHNTTNTTPSSFIRVVHSFFFLFFNSSYM